MPEIQYPTNPNSDTAFVVRDDGKKNRALMTAPQDTSTLELPSNANSTKGYVTIDGKKQRVILTADIGGGGGGGTVDYSKTVQKTATMPAADASNAGQVYMYTGATNANFTQNYIYKNIKTATYTGTVSFEPATLSGTTVACSGDNFANFLTESGVEPLSVVSGTMTFDSASSLWVLVGKDSGGNTVLTFQEYQQDFVDAGFTFTGTPQNGDVVAFTCTVEEASATYAWTRVDVQPADYLPLSGGTMTGPIVLGNGADITPATPFGASIGTKSNPFGSIHAQALRYGYLDGQDTGYFSVPFVFDTPTGGELLGGIFRFPAASFWYEQVIFQCLETDGNFVFGHFYTCVPDEQDPTVYKWVEVETQSRTRVNTTVTLAAANWSSNTQTVSVTGMTADGVVFVNPTPANQSAYTDAGILCTAQAAGSLTFTCDTVPSADITVTVVML